jgi:hypothetical protein
MGREAAESCQQGQGASQEKNDSKNTLGTGGLDEPESGYL